MGARAEFTGGQLCIDLANLEMSAEQQQELLVAVQTTVVKHLASRSATKVVAITMSPNNGYKPLDEPERPDNDKPYEPDREQPEPDKKPPPPKPESAGRR
jgi:hypothetical protein